MMNNMVMCHIVKEEPSLPAEERSIDGCGRPSLEVPFLAPVVRHYWVGVVKVGDHDDWREMLESFQVIRFQESYTSGSLLAREYHST